MHYNEECVIYLLLVCILTHLSINVGVIAASINLARNNNKKKNVVRFTLLNNCVLSVHVFLFCCCAHRRRLPPIIMAPNTRKGWKLWTPRIQRSGPLNRSPRKPHRQSSRRSARSPPALTRHQEVCVSAGTQSPPHVCVYMYMCMCVCADIKCKTALDIWTRGSNLPFPVTTLTLWCEKPPAASGFTVRRLKVGHYLLLLPHVYIHWPPRWPREIKRTEEKNASCACSCRKIAYPTCVCNACQP